MRDTPVKEQDDQASNDRNYKRAKRWRLSGKQICLHRRILCISQQITYRGLDYQRIPRPCRHRG